MYSVDDMKSCIQEWFADCSNSTEVAKIYAEIKIETEKQLDFMMGELTKDRR